MSEAVFQEAPDRFPGAEARALTLRGKSEPLAVRDYRPASA